MMGVNMGYQPQSHITETKKYAWLPVRTTSGKFLWFKEYWRVSYRMGGPFGISSYYEHEILTEKEYFIHIMKFKVIEPRPPFGKSAVYYYKEF